MSYNESLRPGSNYPTMSQSEWDNAPWNEVDPPEKEIEVTISVTLSKTVKISVNDYTVTDSGKDEDGEHFECISYDDCDLKKAVENQISLPQDAGLLLNFCDGPEEWIRDLSDWNVDDFEVILE